MIDYYGLGEPDDEDREDNEKMFKDIYGCSFEDVCKGKLPLLDELVTRFAAKYDCEIDENSQWDGLIHYYEEIYRKKER